MGFYLTASDDVQPRRAETSYPFLEKDVSGHRFLQPETGRWINRDPIGDESFVLISAQHPVVQTALDSMLDIDDFTATLAKQKPGLIEWIKTRLRRVARHDAKNPSLYEFCQNKPIDRADLLGLLWLGSYGNYCGPGWCAGKKQSEADCYCKKEHRSVEPTDDMDRCCAVHDVCLGSGGGGECDQRMCSCLKKINPTDLVYPGGPDPSEIWRWYRKMYGLFCTDTPIPGH